MNRRRKIYEKRSEILTKRLQSKIYSLEADYLESKMKAGKNMNQISEQVSSYGEKLQNLSQEKLREERDKLNTLYQNMIDSSKDKWDEASSDFEAYAEKLSKEKQTIYERTQGWLNDLGTWITDLEDRARDSSGQVSDQLLSQVDSLKKQQTNLWNKMGELPKATGEGWEKISTAINSEVNTLRSSVTKVYHHFFSSDEQDKDTKKA